MTTDTTSTTLETTDGLIPVRGSTVIVLDNPRRSWMIEEGSIAVFRSRLKDGRPNGPRRYLFTCRRGKSLVGASDSQASGAEQCFLAVGLGDAALREFSLDDLQLPTLPSEQDESEDHNTVALSPKDPRLKGIEAWVDRLTDLLILNANVTHTPRPRHFGEQSLELNQAVGTVSCVINWVRVETGSVKWCGRDGWFIASEASTIHLRTTVELENTEQLANGLAQLHRFCFSHVQASELREQQAEAERLRRQSELQLLETTEALRSVGAVLRTDGTRARSETNLLNVLSVIGKELEVTFQPPGKSEDPRRAADPLEAICRASRIPYRRVELRHLWHKKDAGCLLAY